MPNCMICKKPVTTGYVICGACAGEYVTLSYFIDRLAEDIVLDERIPTCGMCVIGDCSSQVNGVTCRNGIKTWLLNKVKEYAGSGGAVFCVSGQAARFRLRYSSGAAAVGTGVSASQTVCRWN